MEDKPGSGRPAAAPRRLTAFIAIVFLLPLASPMSSAKAPVDARHCLDLGSNAAIANCAEQYRPGRAASASGPAPAPALAPPPAVPPAPVAAAERPAPAATASPAPRAIGKRRSRGVDARHCLDLGDILAIARCAERYR
jgi:hypothetical protein